MGRPIKQGLDYFPLNVDFFEDDKIQFVSSRFDEKGELIAIKLLCKIFKAGYYITWNDDTALLFSKGAGRNITPSLANEVVNELIKRGFFHKGLFERFAVLTSNGIQRRYIKICTDAKRKDWQIEEKLSVELFTQEEKTLTPEDTGLAHPLTTESKVKKSKENKRISANAPPTKNFKEWTGQDFVDELERLKDKFPKGTLTDFYRHWKEKNPGGKMRFQLEKTWETELRLEKWQRNNFNNGSNQHNNSAAKPSPGKSIVFGKL